MSTSIILSFFLVLLSTLSQRSLGQTARLDLYTAGESSRRIRTLRSRGDVVCPRAVSSSGITVRCVAPATDRSADFFVNDDYVKTENYKPFFLAGDVGGVANPWTVVWGRTKITCEMDSVTVESVVVFSCDPDIGTAPPPTTRATTTAMTTTRRRTTTRATTTRATTTTTTGSSGRGSDFDRIGCVIVQANSAGSYPGGWVRTSNGAAFNPRDSSTSLTARGVATLEYTFVAKQDGPHMFLIDLTTSGKADYNDLWMEFVEGGWRLKKSATEMMRETGLVKGFQKLNGRGVAIVSGDHDPHSVSTWEDLRKGQRYSVRIGGRSNMVTVHRLLLFVCESCIRHQEKTRQEICIPGSFPVRK